MRKFGISNTLACEGYGVAYDHCKVTADKVENLPYHVTVTPTDLDVTGEMALTTTLQSTLGTCDVTFTNLEFEAMTMKPLKTGTNFVTNTTNTLGSTAAQGTAIAGFELEAEGLAENDLGTFEVATYGELELTILNRCTYKLASS